MSPTAASSLYSVPSGATVRAWPRRSQTATCRSADSASTLGAHILALAEKPWVSSSGERSPGSPWTS